MPEVGVVIIIGKGIRWALNIISKVAIKACGLEKHLNIVNRRDFVGLFAIQADTDQAIPDGQPSPRSRETRNDLFGNDTFVSFSPTNPISRRRLLKCPLRQIQGPARNEQNLGQ